LLASLISLVNQVIRHVSYFFNAYKLVKEMLFLYRFKQDPAAFPAVAPEEFFGLLC